MDKILGRAWPKNF